MKQEVATIEEAEAIVNPLIAENKWAISVVQQENGKWLIQWTEHKMYTAQDGKEYRDEVWTTKDGEIKLIQDIEAEHARNIIRMLLRQDREAEAAIATLLEDVASQLPDEDYPDDSVPPGTLLH